jgi:hypothetical protein
VRMTVSPVARLPSMPEHRRRVEGLLALAAGRGAPPAGPGEPARRQLLSGPSESWGGSAPLACPTVNRFCMAPLDERGGRLKPQPGDSWPGQ